MARAKGVTPIEQAFLNLMEVQTELLVLGGTGVPLPPPCCTELANQLTESINTLRRAITVAKRILEEGVAT
jgi:hypothetical protein